MTGLMTRGRASGLMTRGWTADHSRVVDLRLNISGSTLVMLLIVVMKYNRIGKQLRIGLNAYLSICSSATGQDQA